MEKKRALINAGFTFFPVFLSLMYYFVLSVSGIRDIPQPTDLGGKILEYLLLMPQPGGISIAAEIRIAALLVCLVLVAYSARQHSKTRVVKEREKYQNLLGLASIVFAGIVVLPFVFQLMLYVLQTAERAIVEELGLLLSDLSGEAIFIVPLTALTFLRYLVMYLVLIFFPVLLILCVYEKTRYVGKLLAEQAFIWTFANDVALIFLMIVETVAGSIRPTTVPALYVAIPAALAVIAAPLATLVLLNLFEKAAKILSDATVNEFKEAYG